MRFVNSGRGAASPCVSCVCSVQAAAVIDGSGWLPLHIAAANKASEVIVSRLIEANTEVRDGFLVCVAPQLTAAV